MRAFYCGPLVVNGKKTVKDEALVLFLRMERGVIDACLARNGLKSLSMHVAGCDRDLHRFEVAVGAVTGKNIRAGRAGLERSKHIWMQGTTKRKGKAKSCLIRKGSSVLRVDS